jgi:predicted PurR-regulated permease PerM
MSAAEPVRLTGVNRQVLFRLFFFGAFLFFLYQFLRIISPFFTALMSAVTLTLIFYPAHLRVRRVLKNPSFAAGTSVALILLMIIIPVILLAWLLIKESAAVLPAAREWARNARALPQESLGGSLPGALGPLWTRIEVFLAAWQIDLQAVFLTNLDQFGRHLTAFGAQTVKNIFFIIFDVMVLAFALFFFLRDGSRMVHWVADLVPMESENKELIIQRLDRTLSAVVRGVFVTASTQGVLAGLGFLMMGIQFPVLLGFATAFMALVPFAGAASIWLPVSVFTLMKGATVKGVFLLVWGFAVVSLVDNFLRPIIIGERAKLPILLLFLGILGGLQVYGFIGILMGPLMIACVLAFVKIYREQYHRAWTAKPPETPAPPAP